MSDVRDRLKRCFSAVFPELRSDELERASPSSVATWDSLATVTLIAVVEEEFGVAPPVAELDQGISFELLVVTLEEALGSA